MDLSTIAAWVTPALAALTALAVAFREKAKRAALQAEHAVIEARQGEELQSHVLDRLRSLEGRVMWQAEMIATLTSENHSLRDKLAEQDRVIADLRQLSQDLAGDNTRLAARVTELERERDDLAAAAEQLKKEYASSLGLSQRTHNTVRPPSQTGMKGVKP